MRIVTRRPWFYFLIRLCIGQPPRTTVYTYGRTIFSPSTPNLPDDLLAHERVHQRQQGWFPWLWWARYLVDRRFRFRQELAAYQAQMWTLRRTHRGQNLLPQLRHMASALAGPMYGHLCSINTARLAIDYTRTAYVDKALDRWG